MPITRSLYVSFYDNYTSSLPHSPDALSMRLYHYLTFFYHFISSSAFITLLFSYLSLMPITRSLYISFYDNYSLCLPHSTDALSMRLYHYLTFFITLSLHLPLLLSYIHIHHWCQSLALSMFPSMTINLYPCLILQTPSQWVTIIISPSHFIILSLYLLLTLCLLLLSHLHLPSPILNFLIFFYYLYSFL